MVVPSCWALRSRTREIPSISGGEPSGLAQGERHRRRDREQREPHDEQGDLAGAVRRRPAIGSVSIRSDPYDAVEETLLDEPIDEFIVALAPHGLSRALHLDLPHRLAHFGLPVTTVAASG
jgi:hypothetical protein